MDKVFEKKYVVKNTAGMFDMHKGIIMMFVMIVHTMGLFTELFDMDPYSMGGGIAIGLILISFFYLFFIETMMPSLFFMSGYTYRKTTIKKSIIKQAKALLFPYVVTVIITVISHFIFHYSFYRDFPSAVIETFKVAVGCALGLPMTITMGNYTIFSIGPLWFILALFWGLVVFNILLNYVPEKYLGLASALATCAGWIIGFIGVIPFCISQGLISVVFIFIGHYAKKNKLLLIGINTKAKKITLIVLVVLAIVMAFMGDHFGMAEGEYGFGIISILLKGAISIFAVYAVLHLNVFRGKISSFIRFAGHYSIYVLCIHAIEMKAFPSYLFADKRYVNLAVTIIIHSVLRIAIVLLICYIFVTVKDKVITMIRERKEKKVNV